MKKKQAKNVILDIKGALRVIKRETKEKVYLKDIVNEHKLSSASPGNWEEQAPNVVKVINYMLKKYPCLTFSDLVKEA